MAASQRSKLSSANNKHVYAENFMSSNPYQSPSIPEPTSPQFQPGTMLPQARYIFWPTKGLARWITYIFIGNALFEVAFSAAMLVVAPYLDAEPEFATDEEFNQFMMVAGVIGVAALAMVLVHIVGVVLFCKWTWRSVNNAYALGAQGMENTPGWSVGYHFIPILSLFKPYQAIKETYLASSPEADARDWKQGAAPGFLLAWWLFWIFSIIAGQADFRMSSSTQPEIVAASWYVGFASAILTLVAAILAGKVVHSLADRQLQKQARQQASPAIPPATPFGEAW
jgi:hypothetical protein